MHPKMPGKQDSEEYLRNFPHIGLYDFNNMNFEEGRGFFINRIGGEQFELSDKFGISDSESGCETRGRTRNVSFNETMPPENPEDEDDSVSVQSSDIDVDLDDVDTLVLSIREKLTMDPNYSGVQGFWSDEDSNQSGCSINSEHTSRKTQAIRPSSWKRNHTSYRSLATIQKNKASRHSHRWWTSKSFNDISNTHRDPKDDPYHALQDLIESGSLIKEAVRRINKKRSTVSSSHQHQLGIKNSSSASTVVTKTDNPMLPRSAK